jgi:peptidoglycan hydrolase-like protein with peptidoglycan-binding domain
MHPVLRLHDGYDGTSPELRAEVTAMQKLLVQQGLPVEADGFFGDGTEEAVRQFQRNSDLLDDGIVGPRTWAALEGLAPPEPVAIDFPTTFPGDHAGLKAELTEAAQYRDWTSLAASKYVIPLCLIAGIASRESGWGLMLRPKGASGTGDFTPRAPRPPSRSGKLPDDNGGFGRGIMQIDFDAHEFARTGSWKNAASNLICGAGVLGACKDVISKATSLRGADLWKASLAGYNCGAGNVLRAIQGAHDVDFFTTGRNYGRDTLNRAGWFRMKGWI